MKVTIKTIFKTPHGRTMVFDNGYAADPLEFAKKAISNRKIEFPFDVEVDFVEVNGEDVTEELK